MVSGLKASGIDQEVYLPRYFRQLDLPGGERKCFVSSSHGRSLLQKVATQEEYERVRARYGDTTSVFAHVEALTSLGLRVRFVDNADAEDVMEAIDAGIPVLVGWLHQGNMLRGEPPMCSNLTCGHWSILHGYWPIQLRPERLMTDPLGCQTLNGRPQSCAVWLSRQRAASCISSTLADQGPRYSQGYLRSQTRLPFEISDVGSV